jgi:hypothetical protein
MPFITCSVANNKQIPLYLEYDPDTLTGNFYGDVDYIPCTTKIVQLNIVMINHCTNYVINLTELKSQNKYVRNYSININELAEICWLDPELIHLDPIPYPEPFKTDIKLRYLKSKFADIMYDMSILDYEDEQFKVLHKYMEEYSAAIYNFKYLDQ